MRRTALPLALSVVLLSACAGRDVLQRRYKPGEVFGYRYEGSHSAQGVVDHAWSAEASDNVAKNSTGLPVEFVQWSKVRVDGKDVALPLSSANFRQEVSLAPGYKPSIPDLSRLDKSLHAPVSDLLTFYVDASLASIRGLRKPGDRVFLKHGKPNSWADGRKLLVGEDCIDFDLSLTALDAAAKTATIKVRHQPPENGCEKFPAEWMRRPVSDTANNWIQVTRESDGNYLAEVGKEVFDAEIRLLLPSGIIQSATMDNPVTIEQRKCRDAKLSSCDPPQKTEFVRTIKMSLLD